MSQPDPTRSAATPSAGASMVYAAVAIYLQTKGWRREELGSGWWWKDGCEEATLGGALEQLDLDGVDQRVAVPGAEVGDWRVIWWGWRRSWPPVKYVRRSRIGGFRELLIGPLGIVWNYDQELAVKEAMHGRHD